MNDVQMREVFDTFDADGNGTLEVKELLVFVQVCLSYMHTCSVD